MHPTPAFHMTSRDEMLDLIRSFPFATLSVNGADGPVLALAPLVIDGERLVGHVARTNLFWQAAQASTVPAVAIFHGPDAYVSPGAYPSKADDACVVPTWNYRAVEVRGLITVETDPTRLRSHLEKLTHAMESHRPSPWAIDDAPEDYVASLSRGIVGFHLTMGALRGVSKLSQNKSARDREGVADFLSREGDTARALSELIAEDLT